MLQYLKKPKKHLAYYSWWKGNRQSWGRTWQR